MLPANTRAILLDIEGTTTSISFVFDVLFPYARQHAAQFLIPHANEPALRDACANVLATAGVAASPEDVVDVVAAVNQLMDVDSKSTGLKSLQGMIWRNGYERGDIRSHVFDDVPPALRRWQQEGISVNIFSSGSIEAQRLLFLHTIYGDLSVHISDYFDTTTGPKRDADSYLKIAAAIGVAPEAVLFISDIPEELDASSAAGMFTRLAIREGNKPITSPNFHQSIRSFDNL